MSSFEVRNCSLGDSSAPQEPVLKKFMAILKVVRLGHPVLRRVAQPVTDGELQSDLTFRLIDDMIETMKEYDGVGLAADQVHESLQLAVLEVAENPRYPDKPRVPLTVLVNPRVTSRPLA